MCVSARARGVTGIALLGLLVPLLGGCPVVGNLPETFDVATTATVKTPAPRDSGPPSLANTTWAVFRAPPPDGTADEPTGQPGPYGGLLNGGVLARPPVDTQMFLVDFGDAGRILRVRENVFILTEFYGTEIAVGGTWQATTLPGIEFRSASYGLELNGRFGLAIVAQVRLAGLLVGRAVLYSWGTVTGDRLDGQFGYILDFSNAIGDVLLDTTADQYPVYATRVP